MIRIEMEADSFSKLVQNLTDMLATMGSLQIPEAHEQYKMTLGKMSAKLYEYDREFGDVGNKYPSAKLMRELFGQGQLHNLHLEDWPRLYRIVEDKLDAKRGEEQFDDLLQEIAW